MPLKTVSASSSQSSTISAAAARYELKALHWENMLAGLIEVTRQLNIRGWPGDKIQSQNRVTGLAGMFQPQDLL